MNSLQQSVRQTDGRLSKTSLIRPAIPDNFDLRWTHRNGAIA